MNKFIVYLQQQMGGVTNSGEQLEHSLSLHICIVISVETDQQEMAL